MFVQECGSPDKPALVFLHGNGTNSDMWQAHFERMTDYHCLAPDFSGYGRSNQQEWVSLDETADAIRTLISTRTQNAKAHIVGLSLGSSVALTLLSKAPHLVDHAIIDGAGVLPLSGVTLMKISLRLLQPVLHTEFVMKTIARSMKIPDDGYAAFRQGMLSMSPASFTRSFIQALSMRQPPGLDHTPCPVLFVAGEKEPKSVRQSNAMLTRLMPNAQCRLAPGMGHGWLAEAPDLHISMVQAWLKDEPLPSALALSPM